MGENNKRNIYKTTGYKIQVKKNRRGACDKWDFVINYAVFANQRRWSG